WPLLPDLPTIAEAGVPGYEAASWFTIGAPAKTPKEIIKRLNASVDKFLKTEDGTARLRKLGAEPAGGSPDDMQAYVLAEIDKWARSRNSPASSLSEEYSAVILRSRASRRL